MTVGLLACGGRLSLAGRRGWRLNFCASAQSNGYRAAFPSPCSPTSLRGTILMVAPLSFRQVTVQRYSYEAPMSSRRSGCVRPGIRPQAGRHAVPLRPPRRRGLLGRRHGALGVCDAYSGGLPMSACAQSRRLIGIRVALPADCSSVRRLPPVHGVASLATAAERGSS